jgi:tetratricopeptide (TPR) repeat protein
MQRILGALVAMLAAVSMAPGWADLYDLDRAQRYLAEGNVRNALSFVDSAISSEPDFGAAYLLRASIWLRAGEYQRAIEDDTLAIAHGLDHSTYAYKVRGDARAPATAEVHHRPLLSRAHALGPRPLSAGHCGIACAGDEGVPGARSGAVSGIRGGPSRRHCQGRCPAAL